MSYKSYSTFLILNHNLLNYNKPLNIICTGASRGGTSAVALVMKSIGLNMGNNLHGYTHEDLDIDFCLSQGNQELLYQTLKEKGVEYPGFSLKQPFVLEYSDVFYRAIENPVFVIVIRNIFNIVNSILNRDDRYSNNNSSVAQAILHSLHFYNFIPYLIENIKAPIILVGYEDILANPYCFVNEFASLVNIPISYSKLLQISAQIAVPGYKVAL